MQSPCDSSITADSGELEARAWRALRAVRATVREGAPLEDPLGWLSARDGYFEPTDGVPAAIRPFLELYLPLCKARAGRPLTVGHLGQSLDGHVATASGDSYYVTGPDNVRHLHRLRALADAIIVGAGTVESDDPRLTVRDVEGESPIRVVLDPSARLHPTRRVFTDGAAPTLVVHGDATAVEAPGNAEIVRVPMAAGRLRLDVLLEQLHVRGLFSVFVEGGGATVSRFLEAGLLDRLHVAIAPLVTGSGRPGLSLPARERLADCLRPAHRVYTMGGDVLFDCDLRAAAPPAAARGTLVHVI